MRDYVPPEFDKDAYHCPRCGVYAHQLWSKGVSGSFAGNSRNIPIYVGECQRCHKESYWIERRMIYPTPTTAPLPSEDMPDDVRSDFEEARGVLEQSPRSAAAN